MTSEHGLADFRANGFCGPFDLDKPQLADEARIAMQQSVELQDAPGGAHEKHILGRFSGKPQVSANCHLEHPSIMALANDRAIIEIMGVLYSSSFYLRRSQFWHKPPHSRGIIWHQDTHKKAGIGDIGERSAWVALEDSHVENGCVWLLAGSHRQGIVPPNEIMDATFRVGFFASDEIRIPAALAQYRPVPMDICKGQFFVFHQLCFHGSGPNRTERPRTGLAFRYMPIGLEDRITERLTPVGVWDE